MDILDLRNKPEEQPASRLGGQEPASPPDITPALPAEPGSVGGSFKEYFWEIVKIVVFSLAIIIPVRMFIIQPFIVEGDSMMPNFHDGEYLIVDEISYRFKEPQRGEVVIFHPPLAPNVYYIKRVIGLPGETVELKDGRIYVYTEEFPQGRLINESAYLAHAQVNEESRITLGDGQYYLLGDNRSNSLDSRRLGPIAFNHIKGRALLRAFPFNEFALFKAPAGLLD